MRIAEGLRIRLSFRRKSSLTKKISADILYVNLVLRKQSIVFIVGPGWTPKVLLHLWYFGSRRWSCLRLLRWTCCLHLSRWCYFPPRWLALVWRQTVARWRIHSVSFLIYELLFDRTLEMLVCLSLSYPISTPSQAFSWSFLVCPSTCTNVQCPCVDDP